MSNLVDPADIERNMPKRLDLTPDQARALLTDLVIVPDAPLKGDLADAIEALRAFTRETEDLGHLCDAAGCPRPSVTKWEDPGRSGIDYGVLWLCSDHATAHRDAGADMKSLLRVAQSRLIETEEKP